jgi:hypothetical protein
MHKIHCGIEEILEHNEFQDFIVALHRGMGYYTFFIPLNGGVDIVKIGYEDRDNTDL